MKFLLLIACLISQTGFSQQIAVKVLNSPDTELKVTFPVNGAVFWGNQQSFQLDSNQSLTLPNTLEIAGTLFITSDGTRCSFFVEPSKSYTLQLDPSNKEQPFTITGPDVDGHYAMAGISHPSFIGKARAYARNDSVISRIREAINDDMQAELKLVDELLKKNKISPAFYKNASYEIRYYYATVSAFAIFSEYYKTTFKKDHPYYSPVFKEDFEDAWPQIFETFSLSDPAAVTATEFYRYAHDYLMWYKLDYLPKKNGTFDETTWSKRYFESLYNGFADSFTGTILEYLQASFLYEEAFQQQYQPELVTLYDRFKSTYPESAYLPYLQPEIDKIIAFHDTSEKALKPDQQILDNYAAIRSFDQLLDHFKGKTVFVDMWATWCGPCKAEFAYNAELKEFLKQHNVEMLYISMDKDEADAQWRSMIKFYDLSGIHIRTAEELRTDLSNKFWDGQGYAIPRYLIIKDGTVVEADALHPSDKQRLYEQIDSYL